MADSRDILGKNRKFTGTDSIVLPKGSEAQRVNTEGGQLRFNTDTNLAEYYDGTDWKPIDAPPVVSSISPTTFVSDGSTLTTITISGSGFSQTINNVLFIGNGGTEYTALSVNRVSSNTITCTTTAAMAVSDEPFDVKVINNSGLSGTLEDALDAGSLPVFATAADTVVKSSFEGASAPFSETTVAATDPDGSTVIHSISAGALPPGLSLSSAGAITGTISGSSIQNYDFTVSASDGINVATRQFRFTITAPPFVAATGGNTVQTSGDYKIHTFTSPGTFTVSNAGDSPGSNSVEYLIVGGGGGGGTGANAGGQGTSGGGGAGGYRTNFPSPATGGQPVSAQGYTVTVGSGGGALTGTEQQGNDGAASSVFSISSAGGGGGGAGNIDPNGAPAGRSGGSGGGHGGSGGGSPSSPGAGGAGNTPNVSPPQGNPGGSASGTGHRDAGGGGGAAQAGQGNTGSAIQISAGNGSPNSISGSATFYAGGGAGGSYTSEQTGRNGQGGGGLGSWDGGPGGTPGTANTGGGGGGGSDNDAQTPTEYYGGAGGSGIVIIRYKFQ